jgi:hypothetical protein
VGYSPPSPATAPLSHVRQKYLPFLAGEISESEAEDQDEDEEDRRLISSGQQAFPGVFSAQDSPSGASRTAFSGVFSFEMDVVCDPESPRRAGGSASQFEETKQTTSLDAAPLIAEANHAKSLGVESQSEPQLQQ